MPLYCPAPGCCRGTAPPAPLPPPLASSLPPAGEGNTSQSKSPLGKPSTAPNPGEAGGQGAGSQALGPCPPCLSPRGDAKQDWTLTPEPRSNRQPWLPQGGQAMPWGVKAGL